MKKSVLILALLLPVVIAQFPMPQDKYVNDFAGFLGNVTQLRSMLALLEKNTTTEVVVVTVQTTEPLTPSQYRTELFNTWHIGKKGKDNGLLILYAVKEKRIEVEVGYGLEGILPDSKVGRILDDFYVPYRDSNQTVKGITLATQEFSRVIRENADEVRADSNVNNAIIIMVSLLPFLILAVILGLLVISFASYPKCKRCGKRMKPIKTEGEYIIYKCKNGHVLKRKKRHGIVFVPVGRGGFGGGGFGGGGGGGGSGGGGAGR